MTYSIVAHDGSSGELGVAVQSHWFSVGSIVGWAEPGVGAVATQSIAEQAYGPWLLARLGAGAEPGPALEDLVRADEAGPYRQVAAVDTSGRVAVHTGERCIPHAGHVVGDGYSAQANMMASPRVWPAMAEAFGEASGSLARRMLAALQAAEAEGGDVRGRQSAALIVVPAAGEPWERACELRIEDHAEPLGELARLLALREAYDVADEGDRLAAAGLQAEAGERYRRASALAPGNAELLFWSGLALAAAGDVPAGTERVKRAIEMHPGWRDLLARLGPDLAPGAAPVCAALEEAGPVA